MRTGGALTASRIPRAAPDARIRVADLLPRSRPTVKTTRGLAVIVAILVAGCATSTRPPASADADSASASRHAAEYRRCSDTDPDRFEWFCVIGRIVYGALSFMQTDAGGLR